MNGGSDVLRVVLGMILILHGLIHLLGLVVYLRLATIGTLPYSTALLSGTLR